MAPRTRNLAFGLVALCLVAALGFAGWYFFLRTTKGMVLARARPGYLAHVDRLKKIAASLPVERHSRPVRLDPPPVYDEPAGTYTCDFVAIDRLAQFRPSPSSGPSTDFGDRFETVLYWLGDATPPASSDSTDAWYNDMVNQPLTCRYIVLYRIVRHVPVNWIDAHTYSGGQLDIEAFVVDMQADKVVAEYRVSADPPESVRSKDVVSAVNASIWANGRDKLRRGIEQFGGRVVLK